MWRHLGHLWSSANIQFGEVESSLSGRVHETLRYKLVVYVVHAWMNIALVIIKLGMQRVARHPGRLTHARLCTGQRAGGIYIRYE